MLCPPAGQVGPLQRFSRAFVIPRSAVSSGDEESVCWVARRKSRSLVPRMHPGRKRCVALNDGSLGSDFRTPVESIGLPKPEMTTSDLGGSAKVIWAGTAPQFDSGRTIRACCAPTKNLPIIWRAQPLSSIRDARCAHAVHGADAWRCVALSRLLWFALLLTKRRCAARVERGRANGPFLLSPARCWEVVQLAVHQILDLIILVRVQASQPNLRAS